MSVLLPVPTSVFPSDEERAAQRRAGSAAFFDGFRSLFGAVGLLTGVKRVAVVGAGQEGASTLAITAEPGDATLDAIFAAVVGAGLSLRELRREQLSLEDVFADLTLEGGESDEAARVDAPTASEDEEAAPVEDTAGDAEPKDEEKAP